MQLPDKISVTSAIKLEAEEEAGRTWTGWAEEAGKGIKAQTTHEKNDGGSKDGDSWQDFERDRQKTTAKDLEVEQREGRKGKQDI